MILSNDLRAGRAIIYEGDIYVVKDFQHTAKGNKRSYMQTKLKNLKSGQIIDVRFNMGERLETPFLEGKEYEYLYDEGDRLVLMNTETYDQIHVDADVLGDARQFLKPNERVTCLMHGSEVLSVELPNTVELTVTETPPAIKGATATNQSKDATLETGARIKVPPFIEPGEAVRVDTRTGAYLERAK
jgi:elongation factor P